MWKAAKVFLKVLTILSFVTGAVSWKMRRVLPPKEDLLPAVCNKYPIQKKTNKLPFRIKKGGVEYTIKPLYSYDIHGMLVSYHDADSFGNIYHKAWKDNLNMRDLGLIWGNSAKSGSYAHITFSSGSWMLYWQWSDSRLIRGFNDDEVSNNHVLLSNDEITDKVMSTNWGDQIRMRGYLAEYSHDGGFKRGSSITRTDTGNGACETIFVTDFEILKRANPFWNDMYSLCIGLLIFCVIGRIFVFFKAPFKCAV